MFSLSTSWNSSKHNNGFSLIKEVKGLGFDTVELNFALTEAIVSDILSLKKESKINVSSLHNMCPLPAEIERDEASPDYYSLASTDTDERRLAVEAVKNTIQYANRLAARAVVLHAGRVQIKDRTRQLAGLTDDRSAFERLRDEMIKEREEKKGGYLDNLLKSLSEIVPYSRDMNISIGIENRYYYREIPIPDELDMILKSFKTGSIYYWHDVGHAEVFDRLGLARHKDTLDRFSNRLLGIHLHDIMGAMDDHKAPGLGTFDFSMLKPYITENTIKVIEAHQPATAAQVRSSVGYLNKALGQG